MDIVYFRGSFVTSDQARISIKTNSFQYGTAVFEGIRAYYNDKKDKIFILFAREHYIRLIKNASILMMELDKEVDELVQITKELIARNGYKQDVYIRPIVYFSDEQISPKLVGYTPELAIYTLPLGEYINVNEGIKAKLSSWRRLPDNTIPPRLKISGAYVNSAFAKTEALLCGFDESIMLNTEGLVSEGSAENIFIVKRGTLITPCLSNDILEGITRKAIISIASELGIEVIERSISRTELYQSDEVFLCGTGAQISPVIQIDHVKIGDGKVGKLTKAIQNRYFDIVRGNIPEYCTWVTEV